MRILRALQNFRVGTKILAGFTLLAVLTGGIAFIGSESILRVDRAYSEIQHTMTDPLSTLAEMSKLIQRERISLRDMILAKSVDEQAIYKRSLEEISLKLDSLDQSYARSILSDDMHAAYEKYRQARVAYEPDRQRLASLAEASELEEAEQVLRGDAFQTVKALEESIDALVAMKTRHAAERSETNTAATERAVATMMMLLVVGVLAALALGYFISRLIASPIKVLEEAAGRVTGGDLAVSVDVTGKDEVGRLATSFNAMVTSIHEAMTAAQQSQEAAEQALQEAEAARATSDAQRRYLDVSVNRILETMNRFAGGDLTVHLDVEQDDKIGELFTGFNNAAENLRAMLVQVSEAATSAASASTQISASTEELSTTAQELSTQTGEVAGAVEEMSRTIIENAQGISSVAEMSENNRQSSKAGSEIMQQMIDKVQDVQRSAVHTLDAMKNLGHSSSEVGSIVETIEEIADQTNLLALNAAIEAARAGDQGRGFAVVADEVRKLAERTTSSTKEIADMIRRMQHETAEAVRLTEQSDVGISESVRLAEKAGGVLKAILGDVDQAAAVLTQLSAAAEEQSTTSEQISRSVEMISTASSESAQGISQIAYSSDSLNRLTDELRELVARFTIDASPDRGPERSARSFNPDKTPVAAGNGYPASPRIGRWA